MTELRRAGDFSSLLSMSTKIGIDNGSTDSIHTYIQSSTFLL